MPQRRQPVRSPCREQLARQPVGTTCTTIRRAQSGQYRGGSSAALAWQSGCSPGRPHCPQ